MNYKYDFLSSSSYITGVEGDTLVFNEIKFPFEQFFSNQNKPPFSYSSNPSDFFPFCDTIFKFRSHYDFVDMQLGLHQHNYFISNRFLDFLRNYNLPKYQSWEVNYRYRGGNYKTNMITFYYDYFQHLDFKSSKFNLIENTNDKLVNQGQLISFQNLEDYNRYLLKRRETKAYNKSKLQPYEIIFEDHVYNLDIIVSHHINLKLLFISENLAAQLNKMKFSKFDLRSASNINWIDSFIDGILKFN